MSKKKTASLLSYLLDINLLTKELAGFEPAHRQERLDGFRVRCSTRLCHSSIMKQLEYIPTLLQAYKNYFDALRRFAAFSRSAVFKIALRIRTFSGVTSTYSSSFKNSSDASKFIVRGVLIEAV